MAERVGRLMWSLMQAARRAAHWCAPSVQGRRGRELAAAGIDDRPGPGTTVGGALDEFAIAYFETTRDRPGAAEHRRALEDACALVEFHAHHRLDRDRAFMHRPPPAPEAATIEPRSFGGVRGDWMMFASGWAPAPGAPGGDAWQHGPIDHSEVHVGLLRHGDGPRPWLVLVHPAEMGRPELDARMFRAVELHRDLGVDIAMPILPQHGPRQQGTDGAARGSFLDVDLTASLHGLTQSVWDVRRTLAWIRTQSDRPVGLYGFSLGGYVTAMLTTLDADLAAAVCACPAVDFAGLLTTSTDWDVTPAEREELEALTREAYRPIDVLQWTPQLAPERIALFGALGDRLADPLEHLLPLWEHLERPQLRWFSAGHVTYTIQRGPRRALTDALRTRGIANAIGTRA